ncbi:alpha-galactosidase D [Aspergillus cavernicola]|uniref:Alpha-galactosidase n=1 Tax=Aspergillus cavernicola TaxID=176166 RepID=A0ABR4IXL2_9EURO
MFPFLSLLASTALASPSLHSRLQDGLARTPQMGWNTYNAYGCNPNQSIVHSNSEALIATGLADLGYRYVTIDCGWSVEDRLPDGTLTWNETLFPQGLPALGRYLHERGLLFGAYGDSGILLCGSPPNQTGSLYYEEIDAKTFAEWEVDSLKYDNCYSDAATNYPNVNYSPSTSPHPRFTTMSQALQSQSRPILFQICEWGIDFPALWAPSLGHSWRIGNDIIPHWRSIFRTLNQAAPQTNFARAGQWPDLDMLLVGLEGVLTRAEEETHFSMWGVLKSPLVIGAGISGMGKGSLKVLKNEDVIGFNQDGLGVSAMLRRRWSLDDDGVEVWSGPLEGGRVVAAMVNWQGVEREVRLDLPDVGVQYAGGLRNIWRNESEVGVRTSYTARVAAHGTMLVELADTLPAGVYPTGIFGSTHGDSTTFSSIYAVTSSNGYNLDIILAELPRTSQKITITTSTNKTPISISIPARSSSVTLPVALTAGSNNTITINHAPRISSIHLTPPKTTYYTGTKDFTLAGTTATESCGSDTDTDTQNEFCAPAGSKLTHLSPNGTATAQIPSTISGSKYISIDYINNEVAFDSSWGWGSNSRNLTITVNGGEPVRLEVPLSGRHSELFGPGLGWWDSSRLGVLTGGWREGGNEVMIGNVGGEGGFQAYAPDVVGIEVFD